MSRERFERFTLDPEDEENLGEPLVGDSWEPDERPAYDVALCFSVDEHLARKPVADTEIYLVLDPDGYLGGKPRDWKFGVYTTDPRYAPKKHKADLEVLTDICRGETTAAMERIVFAHFVSAVLGRRELLVARSLDGERDVRFQQMKPPARHVLTPVHTKEDDGDGNEGG